MELPVDLSRALDSQAGTVDLVSTWLERYSSENTRRAYRGHLKAFFGTDDVSIELARAVDFRDVNAYISRVEDELKASTVRYRISAIRAFYDWLLALEAVPRNPCNPQLIRQVKNASATDKAVQVLTREQAETLLREAKQGGPDSFADSGKRDHAVIATLLHCALRRSEVVQLDVSHLHRSGRYWALDIPQAKGGADQYVKCPDHVAETLDRMCEHYGIESGPMFRSRARRNYGDRLSGDAVRNIVQRTAKRAGLPEITTHDLRHTSCTLALEGGASIQQVKTHARHKDVDTTMKYVHQRDKLRKSAADHINISE